MKRIKLVKIIKCCQSTVTILKFDMGWNVICNKCNKECDLVETNEIRKSCK